MKYRYHRKCGTNGRAQLKSFGGFALRSSFLTYNRNECDFFFTSILDGATVSRGAFVDLVELWSRINVYICRYVNGDKSGANLMSMLPRCIIWHVKHPIRRWKILDESLMNYLACSAIRAKANFGTGNGYVWKKENRALLIDYILWSRNIPTIAFFEIERFEGNVANSSFCKEPSPSYVTWNVSKFSEISPSTFGLESVSNFHFTITCYQNIQEKIGFGRICHDYHEKWHSRISISVYSNMTSNVVKYLQKWVFDVYVKKYYTLSENYNVRN